MCHIYKKTYKSKGVGMVLRKGVISRSSQEWLWLCSASQKTFSILYNSDKTNDNHFPTLRNFYELVTQPKIIHQQQLCLCGSLCYTLACAYTKECIGEMHKSSTATLNTVQCQSKLLNLTLKTCNTALAIIAIGQAAKLNMIWCLVWAAGDG